MSKRRRGFVVGWIVNVGWRGDGDDDLADNLERPEAAKCRGIVGINIGQVHDYAAGYFIECRQVGAAEILIGLKILDYFHNGVGDLRACNFDSHRWPPS